jgi:methionyl-tRNA synthetase
MKQKILITSALPYANGPLHFGHIAGAYLPADCYARFQRLLQNDVLYICGSDEYGIAITLSADLAGRTPKEHVDIFHEVNKEFFNKLQISFDHYSRTTWDGHIETVHQFFNDLLANGYIEERVTDQLYSEADQRFLADRYVVGTCPKCGFDQARGDECPHCGASYEATDLKNPRSKLTNAPLTHRATKHWFLLLDQFKDQLKDWLKDKNWKPNVINFIKGYIEELHPRAITRDMTWGVPVPLPHTEGKVLYVWFDAPIGYISATKEWAEKMNQPSLWQEYWLDSNTKLVNFIGKDNIPFHASIFPAMIMGQNQPYKLVDELPANEFYKLEGKQFSKSDDWSIDLEEFFKRYTSDQIRYVIAANAPETSDSEFTWKDFQLRCNHELLGKYGNLINRILVFIWNHCDKKIPSFHQLEELDLEFLQTIKDLGNQAEESYQAFKLRRATQIFMELAQQGNVYFDRKRPWLDAKQEETRGRMQTTLASCIECLKVLALISYPVIPSTANQLWRLLGYPTDLETSNWRTVMHTPVGAGQAIQQPKIVFQKIEDEEIEIEIEKLKRKSTLAKVKSEIGGKIESFKPLIDLEDFRKIDLRVAQIIEAKAIPKSKKLIHLVVDLGLEKRTIVAGLGEVYPLDQLIGKKVVVVANLKPITLMGIQSEGMVLAGKFYDKLELVSILDREPGAIVS